MARPYCLLLLIAGSLSYAAYPFSKKTPQVGEQDDSAMTPNAPGGPRPRNEAEPGRGLPSGAEAYDIMRIEKDPKTGKEHLVPVEKDSK